MHSFQQQIYFPIHLSRMCQIMPYDVPKAGANAEHDWLASAIDAKMATMEENLNILLSISTVSFCTRLSLHFFLLSGMAADA